jgi:kynureninase
VFAASFDALAVPDDVVGRDRETPLERFGAFLALRSTRAAQLQRVLAAGGVLTDTRGEWLRLGPAPYLSDAQLEEAVGVLGSVTRGSLAPR